MPSQWLKNLGHKASHVQLLRPLYNAQLGRRNTPLEFLSYPIDPLGGDAGHGRWIASGQIDIHGKRIPFDMDQWFIGGDFQNSPYFAKVHTFDFLCELKSLGGDMGRKTARQITSNWIKTFESYHHLTWHPVITAHRLVHWLCAYPFAFEQADDQFQTEFHNAFYRQFQHLVHTLDHDQTIDPVDRFYVLWALCVISFHCPELASDRLESWILLIKGAIEDTSLDDGGIITRRADDLLDFAASLTLLRQSMLSTHTTPPLWMTKQIENSLRTLNHLCHTDKNWGCFHGTIEDGKDAIDKLTRPANLRIRRHDITLPDMGYSVLRKGKTSVIINHSTGDHHAPNAMEMGDHGHRLIVNCGAHLYSEPWQQSLQSVHAHSALSVGGSEPVIDADSFKTEMENMDKAVLWAGTHQGFRAAHNLTHTRRIYLDGDGRDCRGEDVLIRSIALKPLPVTVRFHLHPLVTASRIKDGTSVLMRLPSGAGWMFEASNAFITLEDSIYLGHDGMTPRKTMQIVLTMDMQDVSEQIKWAIKRI
jgi:uncharacterized heparinase superfamily protein